MTVRELLARLDSAEFVEWQAFERLEPFGAWAEDYRAGLIAATLANIHRAQGSGTVSPMTFFPWHEQNVIVDYEDPDAHADALDRILSAASP